MAFYVLVFLCQGKCIGFSSLFHFDVVVVVFLVCVGMRSISYSCRYFGVYSDTFRKGQNNLVKVNCDLYGVWIGRCVFGYEFFVR